MKVLAVTPLYPPSSRVGSWLSTHECLAHLARAGHQVTVVREIGQSVARYHHEGVEVWTGKAHIDRLAGDAEVVVSHLGDSGRAAAAAAAAGVPSVRMAHGGKVDPAAVDAADLVVWNSSSYRAGRPGIVVHPPVWPERYATTPGRSITLVNLSADKGVEVFAACAARLRSSRVPFLGVRGGTGRQRPPSGVNIEIQPSVYDMRDVFARTRVLLMPSAYETWGRVGVEALASGIPVVAHPTPGLQESLGDAGIFLHRDDVAAWVATIHRLVTNDRRWAAASAASLARSAELHPAACLDRFTSSLEALVKEPAHA